LQNRLSQFWIGRLLEKIVNTTQLTFMSPQNKWPNFFVKIMKELLAKAEEDK